VGYFEGTDSLLLSRLVAQGIEPLPLSNTMDHYGKYVNHLSKGEVNVIVGYLHKVIPAELERTFAFPLINLATPINYKIPVLVIVPADLHDKAKKLLGDAGPNVHLVAPEEVEAQIRKYLQKT
jgi:hypothetical protein